MTTCCQNGTLSPLCWLSYKLSLVICQWIALGERSYLILCNSSFSQKYVLTMCLTLLLKVPEYNLYVKSAPSSWIIMELMIRLNPALHRKLFLHFQ